MSTDCETRYRSSFCFKWSSNCRLVCSAIPLKSFVVHEQINAADVSLSLNCRYESLMMFTPWEYLSVEDGRTRHKWTWCCWPEFRWFEKARNKVNWNERRTTRSIVSVERSLDRMNIERVSLTKSFSRQNSHETRLFRVRENQCSVW